MTSDKSNINTAHYYKNNCDDKNITKKTSTKQQNKLANCIPEFDLKINK